MKEMRNVSQASVREAFNYSTVRATVTGLGMIPRSLLTQTFVGDAHVASDYEVAVKDFNLNEHAKRAIMEWVKEKGKGAPFSHGRSYFDRELLDLPIEVWEGGIAKIMTHTNIAYDAWRQREGI